MQKVRPRSQDTSGKLMRPATDLYFAEERLRNCLLTHDHSPVATSDKPSRLVAVGTEDGAQHIVLSECVTNKRFVAPSHRWGTSVTLCTT